MTTHDTPGIEDYPFTITERVRYRDTDGHGHVNNAVFVTYLETARVVMVQEREDRLLDEGCQYVVARLGIDFLREILCPGEVEIGIRMQKIGRSSFTLDQAIFQDGKCAARAEVVIVQINKAQRRSQPFSEALRARLLELQP
ncbi:acyl-CoA thioesterase [Paracandidimonas soli]|uniref:Acyl-CoA thioester hydrolase n=1 Tax=Paracandidimonas soli TaxID=1917182 RepID=A0A4R3V958_9BURK|nr:thioesterase family protein [Paracandidimonas soli]TCV01706.1 acyl-CoA thioester hydrolase [Paracandidimonas soli]